MSLIEGKSFGIMNCLQFKILFLGIYEQLKSKLPLQAPNP
jgi:hypothetical protein